MKSYPSIPSLSKSETGIDGFVFDKLDGSNLRFEWHKKRGWNKFGTRNCLLDETHPVLGTGIQLFLTKYADSLEKIFTTNKLYRNAQECVAFAEFYGKNSFAGNHIETDEKNIILFDISIYKKGLIPPKEFIDNFDEVGIPWWKSDRLNNELIEKVRTNSLEQIHSEGIVFKWLDGKQVKMTKIKTNQWLERLKNEKGHDAVLNEV